MKNVIKIAVVVLVTMVGAATLSAQAAGTKTAAQTKTDAPKAKPADAPKDKTAVTPKDAKTPCKAGEVLKNARKPFNAKSNPCVAKPVK